MEAFITILIVSLFISFIFWLGYMWGKMTGYEEGFKACQLIHNEIQEFIQSNI
jgi:hypothetical protein